MYTVQIGIVLLLVFHDFSSKDTAIVVSLLIMMYGMSTAQTASESTISGMHFVTLVRLLVPSTGQTEAEDDIAELTRKETPYTFAHTLFGLFIALIGALKLVYTILIL